MRRLAVLGAAALMTALGSCGGQGSANYADGNNSVGEAPGETIVTPREAVYCEAVEQRVAAEDCEDLNAAAAQVKKGAAAFNVPDPMRRGESVSVQLVVDRRSPDLIAAIEGAGATAEAPDEPPAPELPPEGGNAGADVGNAAEIPDDRVQVQLPAKKAGRDDATPKQIADKLPGTTDTFLPDVGRFMSAELAGQGFKIEPRSPRSQEIPQGGQATWVWEVTALQAGKRSLTLKTVVEGVVGGKRYPLADTPTVRTVTVEVSLPDRIMDGLRALPDLLKAITAALTALAALIAAWFGVRKALANRSAA